MSKINNYHELMLEKARLLSELEAQKAILRGEFDDIKKMLDPIAKGISIMKRIRKTIQMATAVLTGGKAKILGRLLH